MAVSAVGLGRKVKKPVGSGEIPESTLSRVVNE
jgi:hypothetical protein